MEVDRVVEHGPVEHAQDGTTLRLAFTEGREVNGGRGGKQRSRVGGGQGVVGVSHAPNIEQSGLPGQCRFRDFGQTGGRTPRGVLHPGRWHVGPSR